MRINADYATVVAIAAFGFGVVIGMFAAVVMIDGMLSDVGGAFSEAITQACEVQSWNSSTK